jgi:acetyl esterase/lipase
MNASLLLRSCIRRTAVGLSFLLLAAALGCTPKPVTQNNSVSVPNSEPAINAAAFPELPKGRLLQPGIMVHEVATLRPNNPQGKVWVYLPEKLPDEKLPWVLIAPAGSSLLAGMDLAEGDRREHLPYVKAGFGVVAYEIDGGVPKKSTHEQNLIGLKEFRKSRAGIVNARTALDFALAKVPALDRERIFTAGHSSAATLSLLFAENEPRIKGCIAFAPVTDVGQWLPAAYLRLFEGEPRLGDFLRESSPITHVAKLRCPTFVFGAEDDEVIKISSITTFVEDLKKTNSQVAYVQVPSGGHYKSMIDVGLPKAIQWLEEKAKPMGK